MVNHNSKKYLAAGIILALGIFLAFAFRPFFNALFAALILYVLLRPVYNWVKVKTPFKNKYVATTLILILMTIFILLPTAFVFSLFLRFFS